MNSLSSSIANNLQPDDDGFYFDLHASVSVGENEQNQPENERD